MWVKIFDKSETGYLCLKITAYRVKPWGDAFEVLLFTDNDRHPVTTTICSKDTAEKTMYKLDLHLGKARNFCDLTEL